MPLCLHRRRTNTEHIDEKLTFTLFYIWEFSLFFKKHFVVGGLCKGDISWRSALWFSRDHWGAFPVCRRPPCNSRRRKPDRQSRQRRVPLGGVMKLSVGRCFFNALKMDGGETCSLVCIYSPHPISTATNEALTQTAPTAISRSEPRPFTTCPPDNTEKVFFLGSNQAGPPVLDGETYRLSPRDRDGDIDLLSLFFYCQYLESNLTSDWTSWGSGQDVKYVPCKSGFSFCSSWFSNCGFVWMNNKKLLWVWRWWRSLLVPVSPLGCV